MTEASLSYQNISELAQRIRKGELSVVELTEQCLARIASLDNQLNAFRLMCNDQALDAARDADLALREGRAVSDLHGIPFAVKDLFDVKGLPTSAGSRLLESKVAEQDAEAVHKLTRAGMILLGKTNTVQFAYSGVGINHDHGTPHNPWCQTHYVPGGSSSGSGVAVAAGMVPVALGTDTGGSVRIPASLCGTTGLKTTVGRVSRAGVYPLSWSLDSVGCLTRSVEDAALVYQHLQGVDTYDDTTWALAPQDVLEGLKSGVNGLKVAFAESVFWEDVDPEVEAAVRACGDVFEEMGARVDRVEFPAAKEVQQLNPGGLIIAAEAYTLNKKLLEEQFDQLDPVISHRMIKGKDVTADEYLENNLTWKYLRAKAVNDMHNIDALLVPATMAPAQPVAEVDADIDVYGQWNLTYLRNTSIGNILNLCGLSVPCGFTKNGLPIGLMIYVKPFQEEMALRIGHAFQQATDWHQQTPDLGWAKK